MKQKKFKKNSYLEKYERDFILFGLFAFIILSVVSFVFLMPKIYGFYDNIYSKNESSQTGKKYVEKRNITSEVNYKSGIESFDKKNYSAALLYFEKALESEPNDLNYLTELAITNYRLKNYNDAIRNYTRIIALDKNNSSAYNSIGNIYWILKDYDQAEYYFKKAIEINPILISSYNNYALMLEERGEKDRALEILNQGIEENSDNSELKITQRIIEGKK
ncbi:MAG: tetratricopeptide repeat protein [Patescibacteria group bacterium]|nr:tetratricopeptide repeat protein [Patescibacteria group bacterium]